MANGTDKKTAIEEGHELLKEHNNVQYLWLVLLKEVGAIKDGEEAFNDYADYTEYGRLFEKLFENGEYRQDFDYSELNSRSRMELKSFTSQQKFFYNLVRNRFIKHLLSRGVIKSREEFTSGVLNVILDVSIVGSLEDLRAFEGSKLNGSDGTNFTAESEIMNCVQDSSSGQLPA